MIRRLPVRILTCAVIAGSASLSAAVIPGSTAGAATPETVTCTSLTGSETSQAISGCSGTGVAQTGATGKSVVSTKTITWKTKLTSKETYKTVVYTGSKNTCAVKSGYTKKDLIIETGSITGGTATKLVGGKTSADVCLYQKGSTYYVFNKGSVKF
jgi:hypothetical protein